MNNLLETLKRLGPVKVTLLGAVGAVVIGFLIFAATRLTSPNQTLLYSDLDQKDSAAVVAKLDALQIPYTVSPDGSRIFVSGDQVGRLRLTMAGEGIPHGGSLGFELFDKTEAIGTTNFVQGINEMRALEGELERTIATLSVVESARVHLVLPRREMFSREHQEPSASIVLRTRGQEQLPKQQVAAIQNLVATAVPGLSVGRISIIDQRGNLLARGSNAPGQDLSAGLSTAEEQRVAQETKLRNSIEEMLERSVGYGHVRAEVTVDMDFDRVTTSNETYNPDGQVVRSTHTTSDVDNTSDASDDKPVTVKTDIPEGQTTQGGSAANGRTNTAKTHNDELTNYEISKTVTSQVREGGLIRRISVAVAVDGTYAAADAKGERAYQARSPDEIAQFQRLVQSAIGYNEKRGDRVEVVNIKFSVPEEAGGEPPTIFFGLNKEDLFRVSETLVLLVIAIMVITLVIRPLVTRALETAREAALASQRALAEQNALAAGMALPGPSGGMLGGPGGEVAQVEEDPDHMIDISQIEGRVRASTMKKIGEIVEKHPEEAVAIIRSWMYQSP